MNSSKVEQRSGLGSRLQTLANQYNNQEEVWDIGCDHGNLGLSFQSNPSVRDINLVDPSESVINVLKEYTISAYTPREDLNLTIHHSEGQILKLNSKTKCIFIAGMGGKEMKEIIQNLLPQMSELDRLIISPHRWLLELREWLRETELSLVSEHLVEENSRFYQVWVLEKRKDLPKISLYGEEIWQSSLGERYLRHEIRIFKEHQNDLSRRYLSFLEANIASFKD